MHLLPIGLSIFLLQTLEKKEEQVNSDEEEGEEKKKQDEEEAEGEEEYDEEFEEVTRRTEQYIEFISVEKYTISMSRRLQYWHFFDKS